jgi:hypothetical protein
MVLLLGRKVFPWETYLMMLSWSFISCKNITSRNVLCGWKCVPHKIWVHIIWENWNSWLNFYTTTSNPRLYFFFGLNNLLCILAAVYLNQKLVTKLVFKWKLAISLILKNSMKMMMSLEIFFTTKKQRIYVFFQTCASVAFWNASNIFLRATMSPDLLSTAFHTIP